MVPDTELSSINGTKESLVPAVERALDILELLAISEVEPTQASIAARFDLPKGTAHRLLSTLRARGYVEQRGGARGGYTLGTRVVALAARARGQMDVVRAAEEPMNRLAAETGEGCQLSVRVGGRALCVARVPSPSHPEVSLMGGVGSAFPLHAVAVGKTLLAFAPENERTNYLREEMAAYTPRTITHPEALEAELTAIRADGLARDNQEYKRGLRAIAAPIFDGSGSPVAALALPLLVTGDDTNDIPFENALRAATAAISEAMGYRGVI